MASQTYQLVMRSGPNPGKTFELAQSEVTIGRAISNDIVINDAEVSRHHARLLAQAGGYVLEDTGSTNGTFVNGQRLMGPHMLRPGELILLGENISLAFESIPLREEPPRPISYREPTTPPAEIPPREPAREREPADPPPPAYSGPAEAFDYNEELEEGRAQRTWVYVGCGCLAVLLLIVIGGAVVFDQMDLYCQPPFDMFFACP